MLGWLAARRPGYLVPSLSKDYSLTRSTLHLGQHVLGQVLGLMEQPRCPVSILSLPHLISSLFCCPRKSPLPQLTHSVFCCPSREGMVCWRNFVVTFDHEVGGIRAGQGRLPAAGDEPFGSKVGGFCELKSGTAPENCGGFTTCSENPADPSENAPDMVQFAHQVHHVRSLDAHPR